MDKQDTEFIHAFSYCDMDNGIMVVSELLMVTKNDVLVDDLDKFNVDQWCVDVDIMYDEFVI